MRLATVRSGIGTEVVRVEGEEVATVASGPLESWLHEHPSGGREVAVVAQPTRPLERPTLAPVVTQPSKIICLGHNYLAHIEEMGREPPAHPTLFAKFARALVGPYDQIMLPLVSDAMDWEAELAVIIGRPTRHVDPERARDAIAGYTVLNDVTARDYQRRTPQWLQGKTFESTSPLGPWMVTPDEVDHARDLKIRCLVNGDVMQESTTADLVFGPAHAVSYVSRIMTLDPGDVIALGTPSGVGAGRTPLLSVRDGDLLETTIEGIGTLRNACRREVEHGQ